MEWEIAKMEIGNEMEIFITLTKYNIHQQREEGKPLLAVYNWVSILSPLSILSNVFMGIETYLLMLISTVYNINFASLFKS